METNWSYPKEGTLLTSIYWMGRRRGGGEGREGRSAEERRRMEAEGRG